VPLPSIYTYKITFEGAPYFYFGVHKERLPGEEYWGSPHTHKKIWSKYKPIKEVLEYYESWEEATQAEIALICPFLNDSNCLNESAGRAFSLESCKRGGRKGGRKAVESGQLRIAQHLGRLTQIRSGHFSKIATRESRVKGGRIGGKIAGRKAVESGQLREASEIAYSRLRKPILLIDIKTGDRFYFNGLGEAARALKLHKPGISAVANGRSPSYKGFFAVYLY
jgi:hypothetical protein